MKICGIELKASEAILALVASENGELTHLASAEKKIALVDDEDPVEVKAFYRRLQTLIDEQKITHVAIKKRGKKGDFAGGPVTFKMEGLLQMLEGCDVRLIAPQTLNAAQKKHNFAIPAGLNKYQHDAYLVACTAALQR